MPLLKKNLVQILPKPTDNWGVGGGCQYSVGKMGEMGWEYWAVERLVGEIPILIVSNVLNPPPHQQAPHQRNPEQTSQLVGGLWLGQITQKMLLDGCLAPINTQN